MMETIGLAALWLAAALALVHLASGQRAVAIAQAVMAAIAGAAMIGEAPTARLLSAAALFVWAVLAIHQRSRWSRRAPTANVALVLAIAGAGLLAIGAICDRIFIKQTVAIARPGERLEVGPWLVEFATVNAVVGPDYTAIEAELRATRGRGVSLLMPQSRMMISPPREAAHIAAASFWDGRLSASLATKSTDARQVRLQWQPFLPLVWLGAMLMALGGLLLLVGKSLRWWRRRPAPRGRYQ